MRTTLIVPTLSALLLTGCLVSPRRGGGLEVIPALPVIVEIGDEPYYEHGGYHYFYSNDRWLYSTHRQGPWTDLPRSHWPKETRHRGHDHPRH